MTSTTLAITPTSHRTRRKRFGASALAGILAATGLVAATSAAHATPTSAEADALLAKAQDCRLVHYTPTTYVECVVTESGAITFTDIVPESLAPHPGSPVAMTARGGAGASSHDDWRDRTGGAGGIARTVASADDIEQLHVAVGRNGTGSGGGSSTIVSERPIEDLAGIDDVYLVAGGGGALGNRIMCGLTLSGGGSGGAGGFADANHASTGHAASGRGGDGGTGTTWACSNGQLGQPGRGGHLGVAGIQPGDRRSDGTDGIGGHGGTTSWQGGVGPGHTAGRGGVTSAWAMGGGGWGGGAGGERNAGGGGGGSHARAVTEHVPLPRNYASTPSVTLAWPLHPADT